MNYKKETLSVYENFPEYFDEKFGEYTNEIIKKELQEILALLPHHAKMLDMGSGSGNQALFFKQNRCDVICLDISEKMLEKCREKDLKTIKADIENLNLGNETYDVIWANASLLHIPKKNISKVLNTILKILKDNGYFFLSLKEGTLEGFVPFEKSGQRWFSHYTDREIRSLLKKDFDIIKHWRVSIPGTNKVFLDYFCRKKR